MNRKLIIFAGAGASRGVSPEKYPMTLDFRKQLPPEITNHSLFQRLDEYLRHTRKIEKIDIEHVLWELGRLIQATSGLTTRDFFATNLLETNQISSVVGPNMAGQQILAQLSALEDHAVALQNKINEQIYRLYAQKPSLEEMERTWKPLLEWASSAFDRIDLVTTNYDLIFEYVLNELPNVKIDRGLDQGPLPVINTNRWVNNDSEKGFLTKLHGSVDWKFGDGGTADEPIIRPGHPEFDGSHDIRSILYPGFKGRPEKEPFIKFHDYFRRRLVDSTHLLCIGFAFRDEFINEIISTSFPSSAQIAVVDPAQRLPSVEFLKDALHIQQAFGKKKLGSLLTDDGLPPFSLQDVIEWAS